MNNHHSPHWFEVFLDVIPAAQTDREIAFLTRQLPVPPFRTVLDLCCGSGRHSCLLAGKGYQVTGIDVNREAIEKADSTCSGSATFLELDLRDIGTIPGSFDAVLNLWQSFGYFEEAQNIETFQAISGLLTDRGRLVLDIYHRAFFEAHQGTRIREVNGRQIAETKTVSGHRLTVTLDYGPNQEPDEFEWQLYTPSEISELASRFGLTGLLACTDFDEDTPASAERPRMQLVFQKSP
jgi:SAM-dependent methyltransferase